MKINRIKLKNFKLFEDFELSLHPEFTLLIGENGSGKSSIVEALAIVCGVWLYEVPDKNVSDSRVHLDDDQIRMTWQNAGDRPQFVRALSPCSVQAHGLIAGSNVDWDFTIKYLDKSLAGLEPARREISKLIKAAHSGKKQLLPVIAYYGAGRAWMPHLERRKSDEATRAPRSRWEAFYDCLKGGIRIADLRKWFADEMIERRSDGRFRPGFEIVKKAILRCVPNADDAWYDTGMADIVLSINKNPQPFFNLSAGQLTMLALVADIAIKCVIQNNYLVPPDRLGPQDDPIPQVLKETPGVVLIDEIDVHLHPRWQRRVIEDLRTMFPSIQFVATTHSPQVIGQVDADCIRVVSQGKPAKIPHQAFGLDSNWILEYLMEAKEIDEDVGNLIQQIEAELEQFEFESAEKKLDELRKLTGETVATTRLDIGVKNAKALTEPRVEYKGVGRNLRSIDLRPSDEIRERHDEDMADDETH